MSLKESSCDSSSLLPVIATSSAELIAQDTKFCRIIEILKKPNQDVLTTVSKCLTEGQDFLGQVILSGSPFFSVFPSES